METQSVAWASRVAILAYDGCLASELFGFRDVMALADGFARRRGQPRIETILVTVGGDRIRTSGGEELRGVAADFFACDLYVVPGFLFESASRISPCLAGLGNEFAGLRQAVGAGKRVASICVGAFLLGAAGLLDGRRATTAWIVADNLARRHPTARIDREALIVEDGPITTTGAFSAAHDLALRVVASRSSASVAEDVGSVALIEAKRAGQAPFISRRLLAPQSSEFADRVAAFLLGRLSEPYSLTTTAEAVGASPRTLLRRFSADRGETPLSFLQAAQVDRAKRLLTHSGARIDAVAHSVGYNDVGAFRVLFQSLVGEPPGAYRRRFRRNDD